MNKLKSVKFNFIMNFILTASNLIFPLITFPYISRVVLAEGVGIVAFAGSILGYFLMLASLGIPTYGIRACARVRNDKVALSKLVHELLIIHSITTLISFIAFVIAIHNIDKLQQESILMYINAFSMLLNVIGASWLYSALEQYSYITIRTLIFKLISVILIFLFVKNPSDYIIYGSISLFAAMGSNVLNFYNLRKFIHFKWFKNYNLIQHIYPILIFFAQTVAVTIYTNLDTVMLGFISGNVEVGYYNASIKVKVILLSLVTSLGSVLLPRLSYYIQTNETEKFEQIVRKALKFVLIASIPLTLYFITMTTDSILLLSGSGFLGAKNSMIIITPTIILIGISNLLGIQVLTPMGKEKIVLFSVIIGAVIDFILNLVLIPMYSASGAAFSTLIAEFVVLCVQLIVAKEIFFKIFKGIKIHKILIANLISYLILVILKSLLLFNPFVNLILSSIVFFSAYLLALLIFREDFTTDIVLNIVKNLKSKIFNG